MPEAFMVVVGCREVSIQSSFVLQICHCSSGETLPEEFIVTSTCNALQSKRFTMMVQAASGSACAASHTSPCFKYNVNLQELAHEEDGKGFVQACIYGCYCILDRHKS